MAEAAVAPEFRVWTAPGHAVRIEYSDAVMDQIRMAAVDGYHLVPHGGVETGGILFGTHQKNLVRILAWRPLTCEYSKGPSFVLSEKDEAGLKEATQSWRDDPELAGLEPAGWYHSHTRSEIFLSDLDLDLFQRFFPQPWQVALVLRPTSFAATRAGFFFREADGSIRAESSYCEFSLSVPRAAEEPAAERASAQASEGPPAADTPPVSRAAPAPAEPEALATGTRRRASWKWYGASLLLIAAAGFGIWNLNLPAQRLSLSATDTGGQLHIVWDRAAGPVRRAVRGSIEIQDHGARTEVKLTPADLRSGSIAYARQSGDVVVRLTVEPQGGPAVQEVTRFLEPGGIRTSPAVPVPAPPPPDPAKQELEREAEAMRTRIEQQKTELSKLEQIVGAMRQPKPAAAKPARAAPPPVTSGARKEPVTPPRQPEKKPENPPASVAASIPAPKMEIVPAAPVHIEPPVQTSTVTPTPAPPPPAPARPKAALAPSSGRMIWTGRLPKNGRLVIEGRQASAGALSGALPARAARVTAYPGDLTAEGITLFTPEMKYIRPLTEAAGAQNGWNRTTYTWEPKRAAGIRVVEQPSPQNGYKLILESETSKLSILVMEWHATQ